MSNHDVPVSMIRTLIVIDRERRRKRGRSGANAVLRIIGLAVLISVLGVGVTVGMGVGTAAAAYSTLTQNLPTPKDVETASIETFETTKIYAWGPDRDGDGQRDPELIYEVIDPNAGDRHWISLSEIPEYVICGTVAAEDKTFWDNPGFNVQGIAPVSYTHLTLPTN